MTSIESRFARKLFVLGVLPVGAVAIQAADPLGAMRCSEMCMTRRLSTCTH